MIFNDRKFIWFNNFLIIGMIKRGVGVNCYFVYVSGIDILNIVVILFFIVFIFVRGYFYGDNLSKFLGN